MPAASAARAWRQDKPVLLARFDIMVAELRVEIERLQMEAKLKARVAPDEAEGAEAQAKSLENALLVLEGDLTARLPGPGEHVCAWPGCGADAPYGVGIGQPGGRWSCGAHRDEVRGAWQHDRDEAERRAAEALAPKTDMAGMRGRLI